MSEYSKDIEREATRIADEVCGKRPTTCTGWNAKIYSAAWEAAARALPPLDRWDECKDPNLRLARQCAERVLMARLTKAPIERRDNLRERIAGVRAGLLDNAPEVQSALLAITDSPTF